MPLRSQPQQPHGEANGVDLPMRRGNMRLARYASLRQLQVFEAIARLGSFTRAGEELHLAQPTVSTQIKRLTDAIGMPLFEQVGRSLSLTQAGEELLWATRQIFDALDHVEMKVADLKGLKQGYLRLAVITTAKYFAPEALGGFCRKYPGMDVSLKVTNRDRILERITRNEDDLYILGHDPSADMDVVSIPFAPNPLYVIGHRRHPLAHEHNIPLERLTQEPFIMREPGSGIREAVENAFEDQGLRPQVRMELGSNEAIKHSILGQLGISVLSLHTLVLDSSSNQIAILDVQGFPVDRQWHVVYPRGKELSVAAQAFLDYLKGEGKRLSGKMDRIANRLKRRNSAA